ncbi:tRNA (adenosine(37)-N6)-threonylcarbamoyltransferase complex dimerization subunit type 1 TsaB [Pseudoruegeria aquimaris]|nr:tRNA (adenosine(37)-N6)-threonylcarbamoyltransferase complex dimerization subunit type 1 TsaB [Pseudoruegeria aquimaris]
MTATLLAFDTSAAHCTAALLAGGDLRVHRFEEMAKGQAERLFPLIEEVLAEAGLGYGELSAIAVGTGPGNFTGIRISVSAARGLALALGRPAIGVSALEAAAFGTEGPVLAAVDARRGKAYVEGFGTEAAIPAQLREIAELPAGFAGASARCIGSGAQEVAARIGATVAPPAAPLAEAIARIAADRLARDPAACARHRPAPLYLRAADAAPARDAPPALLDP